jgi:hypothetical protein
VKKSLKIQESKNKNVLLQRAKKGIQENRTFDHVSDGFAGQIKERLDVQKVGSLN